MVEKKERDIIIIIIIIDPTTTIINIFSSSRKKKELHRMCRKVQVQQTMQCVCMIGTIINIISYEKTLPGSLTLTHAHAQARIVP